MHPDERRIYIALLTAGIIVVLVIVFFVITILRYQRKRVSVHLITSGEETRIQEIERTRIGSDLHDGINSGLSAIKLRLSLLSIEDEKQRNLLNDTMAYIDQLSDQVRNVSKGLLPIALEREGLQQALEELVAPLLSSPRYEMDYRFRFPSSSLTPEAAVHIYRICQEVISNILRHAGASRILLHVWEEKRTLFVRIEDNGIGFDSADAARRKGLGLQNIRMRADILQAHLYVKTSEGNGTRYDLEIPKRAVTKGN